MDRPDRHRCLGERPGGKDEVGPSGIRGRVPAVDISSRETGRGSSSSSSGSGGGRGGRFGDRTLCRRRGQRAVKDTQPALVSRGGRANLPLPLGRDS